VRRTGQERLISIRKREPALIGAGIVDTTSFIELDAPSFALARSRAACALTRRLSRRQTRAVRRPDRILDNAIIRTACKLVARARRVRTGEFTGRVRAPACGRLKPDALCAPQDRGGRRRRRRRFRGCSVASLSSAVAVAPLTSPNVPNDVTAANRRKPRGRNGENSGGSRAGFADCRRD